MTTQQRKTLITFLVAGAAAVFGEHLLKPSLKRKMRV